VLGGRLLAVHCDLVDAGKFRERLLREPWVSSGAVHGNKGDGRRQHVYKGNPDTIDGVAGG